MSVSSGFFDSVDGDRLYSALQLSSIFDGIIRDGVYMSYGDHFFVSPNGGMQVAVGTGRGWFDHTWILNDVPLPINIDASDLALNRIDCIYISINRDSGVREGTIKYMKGSPAANASKPTLPSSIYNHSYPLAYINVPAGATVLDARNLENAIGTSATPFVTGVLETINIDTLIAQWRAQWLEYYNGEVTRWTTFLNGADSAWLQKMSDVNSEWVQKITDVNSEWSQKMSDVNSEWEQKVSNVDSQWTQKISDVNDDWGATKDAIENGWEEWYNSLQNDLSPTESAGIARNIEEMKDLTESLSAQVSTMDEKVSSCEEQVSGFDDRLNELTEQIGSAGHTISNSAGTELEHEDVMQFNCGVINSDGKTIITPIPVNPSDTTNLTCWIET